MDTENGSKAQLLKEVKDLRQQVAEFKARAANRQQAEAEQRRTRRLMETRLSLIEYAATHSLQALLTRALDEVGVLVDSPIGFYHFIEPDQQTLSLQQWSTRTLEEFCQTEGGGMHYPVDQAGVWVDCVHARKPVVHNDYAALPHKKGLPQGHAEVTRELVVPVMRDNNVVAILGVGNKPTDYMQEDVETVAYLADVTWEIVRQKRAMQALRQERDKAQKYLDLAGVMFIALDAEGDVILINQKGSDILGYAQEEILGRNWFVNFVPAAGSNQVETVFGQLMAGEIDPVEYYENPVVTKSGEERIIAWHNAVLHDHQGNITGILGSGEDVTEYKRAEDLLKQALEEKTVLLQELYHRTRNNMHVICALLEFQTDYIDDQRALHAFSETQNRIRAMALVHQKLYQSQNLSRINLQDYIRDLAALLIESCQIENHDVALDFDMEDVYVLMDIAIPCGLVLNELISNALQHAFPQAHPGKIYIGLHRVAEDVVELQIADNGVGVPPGFDFRNDGRLGLQSVFALAERQLHGQVQFDTQAGVSCQLRFRDDLYTPRV